jgi:hypothetical protein
MKISGGDTVAILVFLVSDNTTWYSTTVYRFIPHI